VGGHFGRLLNGAAPADVGAAIVRDEHTHQYW
jgi:hypothetical protein